MSNVVPIQQQQEPRPLTIEEEFDIFWDIWPHKIAKGAARRAYVVARKKTSTRELAEGVVRYIQQKPSHISYCYPATWLNGERWLDEPAVEPMAQEPTLPSAGPDTLWRVRVRAFKRDGFWPPLYDYGPAPGQPRCKVPEHILREFGL